MLRVNWETDIFKIFLYSGEFAVASICANAPVVKVAISITKKIFFIMNCVGLSKG